MRFLASACKSSTTNFTVDMSGWSMVKIQLFQEKNSMKMIKGTDSKEIIFIST